MSTSLLAYRYLVCSNREQLSDHRVPNRFLILDLMLFHHQLDIYLPYSSLLICVDILSYFYFINIKKHNLTQFIKNKQNINKKNEIVSYLTQN